MTETKTYVAVRGGSFTFLQEMPHLPIRPGETIHIKDWRTKEAISGAVQRVNYNVHINPGSDVESHQIIYIKGSEE